MLRQLKDGSTRFCYGLFISALIVSAVIGMLAANFVGGEWTDRTTIWFAAVMGANLGPLFVHLVYKNAILAVLVHPRRNR